MSNRLAKEQVKRSAFLQSFPGPGNEKGIALVMVLVLSLIALAIVATLTYMVLQGTKFSGAFKRYATALDASHGGREIMARLIAGRGELIIDGLGIDLPGACTCGFDSDLRDEVYPDPFPNTCLCRKLCMPPYRSDGTDNWGGGCSKTGNPLINPDISPFDVSGYGTRYTVFAKIVDTAVGVTDLSGEDLGCGIGAAYECGTYEGPPTPYLYRIEVESLDANNTKERARLSVLYAY